MTTLIYVANFLCRERASRGMGYSRYRSGRGNIRRNAAQGRRAELQVRAKYKRQGYSVKRTGIGHDFKATKRGPFGRKVTKFVEVKSGGATLSPTQRQAKSRLGGRYKVERVSTSKSRARA